jgi:hypothetical protein
MSDQSSGAHNRPIDELIQDSSLGTEAARRLRNRTSASQAALAQRLVALRNAVANGDLGGLVELGELCEQVGSREEAADCYRRVAASSLMRLATLLELEGETDVAAQWKARARTIYPTK